MKVSDLEYILTELLTPALVAAQEGREQPPERLKDLHRATSTLRDEDHWSLPKKKVLDTIWGETAQSDKARSISAYELDKLRDLVAAEVQRQKSADPPAAAAAAPAAPPASGQPAPSNLQTSSASQSTRNLLIGAIVVVAATIAGVLALRKPAVVCTDPAYPQQIPYQTGFICASNGFAEYIKCLDTDKLEELSNDAKNTVQTEAALKGAVEASAKAESDAVGNLKLKYSSQPMPDAVAACIKKYEGPISQNWPPRPFDLQLHFKDPYSQVTFDSGVNRHEYEAFQRDAGYYLVHDVILPDPGSRFVASLRPVMDDAAFLAGPHPKPAVAALTAAENLVTRVCLVGRNRGSSATQTFASLDCVFGQRCTLGTDNPPWTQDCPATARWTWPSFEREAYADSSPTPYWATASLETLARRQKDPADDPPYMDVEVKGRFLRAPAGVALYTMEVKLNGTPAYVDGWRPSEVPQGVDPAQGFSGTFPLQNLGFDGADHGFERLDLTFTWMNASSAPVATSTATAKFVAFRDIPAQKSTSDVADIEVSGLYMPSHRVDRYSVFLASSDTFDQAVRLKHIADAAQQTFEDQELQAVVRPPLKAWRLQPYNSPHWAVLLGVVRPTSQIAFSFDEAEADRLCRRAFEIRTALKATNDTVFRFEWPSPGEKALLDPYKLCREL